MPVDLVDRNQELIVRRLKRDRLQSVFAIDNQEIRIMELQEEILRVQEDIGNHKTRIAELDKNIAEQETFAASLTNKK